MNRKTIAIILLATATLFACKKDKTGTVRYINEGDIPAEIFLDNQSLGIIPGQDSFDKTGVGTGVHEAKAKITDTAAFSGTSTAISTVTFPVRTGQVSKFYFR